MPLDCEEPLASWVGDVMGSYPLHRLHAPDIEVVVDIGANMGLFTMMARAVLRPKKIVSYEPEPGNFQALEKNICLFPECAAYQEAVLGDDGTCSISNPFGNITTWRAAIKANGPVKAVGIRTIIEEHGPIDLLKIDCEGGEWSIIPAMKGFEAQVRSMMVEYHGIPPRHGAREFLDLLGDTFPGRTWETSLHRGFGMFWNIHARNHFVSLE
jgi:FkbM family methyltransferase